MKTHTQNNGHRRIGLIGAGWVTTHHLTAWRAAAPRASVVAIADPAVDRAKDRAATFGITYVFDSAAAMLKNTELDAVDIAAPREMHAPLVKLAAEYGFPILCQKPLAPTFDEAVTLLADVAGKCRLMVHENWRFRPYYRQIHAWLGEGRIGKLVQGQMTLLSSGLIPDADGVRFITTRQPFMVALDRALVTEILIHHIDTLRFLLGDLSVAYARIGKTSNAIKAEDRATVVFETSDGGSINLMGNIAARGFARTLSDRLTLIGETGAIRLDDGVLICTDQRLESIEYDVAASYQESYNACITHFLDCLDADVPFETSPDDNLATLRLVEDIYAATPSRQR